MQQTCPKRVEERHDWVGKVIHWELCTRLDFDQTTLWFIHKSESAQEKKTYKIPRDFEIQTDHLIPTRRK